MITARELEDILRLCEQRKLVKPGFRRQRHYACDCGRVYTHITELYLCSAAHNED